VSDTPDPANTSSTISYTLSEGGDRHPEDLQDERPLASPHARQTLRAARPVPRARPWDLKNNAATTVPDGSYTYEIDATDAATNPATQRTGTITVDTVTNVSITSVTDPRLLGQQDRRRRLRHERGPATRST